jgi:hypothetical protein
MEPSCEAILDVVEALDGTNVPETAIAEQLGAELAETQLVLQSARRLGLLTVSAGEPAHREPATDASLADSGDVGSRRYTITNAGRNWRRSGPQ